MSGPTVSIEVVYVRPERCWSMRLRLPAGSTVGEAILAADLAAQVGVPLEIAGIAIHGRTVDEATPLREGDRVELLRPLRADPKQARRARAARPESAG